MRALPVFLLDTDNRNVTRADFTHTIREGGCVINHEAAM